MRIKVFDSTSVQSRIDDCRSVAAQYMPMLETGAGTEPVGDIVSDFSHDLDNAGAGDLISEEQSQYNTFLAARSGN